MDRTRTQTNPSLTPRQREILAEIARGRSNPEIAAELGIGYETVKMHVSRILGELGVSSREEAAAWWREGNRPVARARRTFRGFQLTNIIATAGAAVALAGAGITMLFVSVSSDGDGTVPAQPAETATPAPTMTPWPTPTPDPADVGWEAAYAGMRFELVDFYADPLVARAHVRMTGRVFETGYPLIYVTDATGNRQRTNGGRTEMIPGPGGGGYDLAWELNGTIDPVPGSIVIEVTPVREYVIPPLGPDEPTPIWARYEVDFMGYDSELSEQTLPDPHVHSFAGGEVFIDRIATTEERLRYEWHVDLPDNVGWSGFSAEPGDLCISSPFGSFGPALFDANGARFAGTGSGHGGGGGASDAQRSGYMDLGATGVSGQFTLAFAASECLPEPVRIPVGTPGPGGAQAFTYDHPTPIPQPAGKSDLQHLRDTSLEVAEFRFTIP